MEHSTLSTGSTAGRNTLSGPANTKGCARNTQKDDKEDKPKVWRAWLLTWNNHTEEDWAWLKEYCEDRMEKKTMLDYRFQEEIGKKCGTPHIQGALYYKSARTLEAVRKDLPKCHVEGAIWNKIKNYCRKKDTATGLAEEATRKKTKPLMRATEDPLEGHELYPWQQEVIELIKTKPDSRKLYWFWEPNGNSGKTSLAKHLVMKGNGDTIYVTGKTADIKYGITNLLLDEDNPSIRVVLLDFTRSQESYISWQGIEEVKNGIFFNTKYECSMVTYDSPHIICFANYEPSEDDKKKLSEDRWVIKRI